jgi:general secretion pathway protein L
MASLFGLVRHQLQLFFDWWLGELAGLIPARLSPAVRRDRHRLVLALGDGAISVAELVGDREQELGAAPSEPGQATRIAGLLRKARRRKSPITLRLAPGMGLRKVLELPLAARDDLDQLLRFEMDRLTPFRSEDVVFAHRVLDSEQEQGRMSVELQVAPRVMVEQALATAAACKVTPTRVELAGPGAEGRSLDQGRAPALNLLPAEQSEAAPASRLNRWLGLVALALAAAALAIPLQQQRSTVADLERQVAAAKEAAQQSVQLRQRLDALRANVRFLVDEKDRTPMVTRVLAELTRVIPDHAHVEQLNLRDGTLQLHGFASTASELIGLLEQSSLFRTPQFRSPVTQDPRLGEERFHLSVELHQGDDG